MAQSNVSDKVLIRELKITAMSVVVKKNRQLDNSWY